MRRLAVGGRAAIPALLLIVLVGCGYLDRSGPPEVPIAVSPLSKVTVHNQTDSAVLARMNWPDGFVQVYRVHPGQPSLLTGAIGTTSFPTTVDIRTEDCDVLAVVQGLAPGSAGLITFDDDGPSIQQIFQAMSDWTRAETLFDCGATEG